MLYYYVVLLQLFGMRALWPDTIFGIFLSLKALEKCCQLIYLGFWKLGSAQKYQHYARNELTISGSVHPN